MSDLTQALTELRDSLPAYEEAQLYSDGRAPEIFASRRIRRALRGTAEKFKINFARTAITEVTDRLKVTAVTHPDPKRQAVIDRIQAYNQLDLEMPQIHDEACTLGDTYLIVWPAPEEDSDDVAFDRNGPTTTRLFYDPENQRKVSFGIKAWLLGNGKQRVDLYYADRIERYVSTTTQRNKSKIDETDFEHYLGEDEDPEAWPMPNPFGRVPIFHFRTDHPYGVPEHADAYGPQNILNKLTISHMSTVDFTSFPQRYALTDQNGKVEDETPEDLDDLFEEADEEEGDGTSALKSDANMVSGPGTVQWFDNVKEVGTFNTAQPDSYLAPILAYVGHMATVTKTAMHAYQLGGQPPTGESRRRAEGPTIHKAGQRQTSFGGTWRDAFAFALLVAGVSVADDTELKVEWEPLAKVDDVEGFELVKAKTDAGVPLRQALLEAGYTTEQLDSFGIPDFATPAQPEPVAEPEPEQDQLPLDDGDNRAAMV